MTWSIDGVAGRTVYKNETYNDTDSTYHYPQTPARVQLSLWPAGLPSNGEGTIEWAGGLINWDSPYMQNGYYYAQIKEVTVECYDPPDGTKKTGDSSYYYTSTNGLESDVAIGDEDMTLASLYASGEKPDYDPNSDSDSSSQPTSTPETVPGISGGGNQAIDGDVGGSGSGTGSGASPSGSSLAGGSSQSFVQGSEASTVMAGSAVALLGFFVAALLL